MLSVFEQFGTPQVAWFPVINDAVGCNDLLLADATAYPYQSLVNSAPTTDVPVPANVQINVSVYHEILENRERGIIGLKEEIRNLRAGVLSFWYRRVRSKRHCTCHAYFVV